ncbi:MAG: hypothetical protein R3C19_06735 [Planctomycetaceae bacterium]
MRQGNPLTARVENPYRPPEARDLQPVLPDIDLGTVPGGYVVVGRNILCGQNCALPRICLRTGRTDGLQRLTLTINVLPAWLTLSRVLGLLLWPGMMLPLVIACISMWIDVINGTVAADPDDYLRTGVIFSVVFAALWAMLIGAVVHRVRKRIDLECSISRFPLLQRKLFWGWVAIGILCLFGLNHADEHGVLNLVLLQSSLMVSATIILLGYFGPHIRHGLYLSAVDHQPGVAKLEGLSPKVLAALEQWKPTEQQCAPG